MKTLGIVGGGITGLTCAYKLQHEFNVTVFEQDNHWGGHAQTHRIGDAEVEAGVAVAGELTYKEFFKLMREINFDKFISYELSGFRVHAQGETLLYFDTNAKRLRQLMPKFLKESPASIFKTIKLVPFIYRLYRDYRKGLLDDVMVMDAYEMYPRYSEQVATVLTVLSLITAVSLKNVSIGHIFNFIFDTENNHGWTDPISELLKTFKYTKIPEGGVGAYINRLREKTTASFNIGSGITKVERNEDGTITVVNKDGKFFRFDHVIVATQPFQAASFLEYIDEEEREIFTKLANFVTHSIVTNHTDSGVLDHIDPAYGLVDYRIDSHDDVSQVTIVKADHYYTSQLLPDSVDPKKIKKGGFSNAQFTPDNYSINPEKILTQHIHGTQQMMPETRQLFDKLIERSGEGNLYFACAALSNYPTSQEGGVRSALRVVKELKNNN
ncbi:FAD-dependent oxidoreductase [Spongiibacter marinus]|uniref:FAD-dependent oxidoreductase n=1 Tax=Spongiibacter marinus TaxID=354246 RepID=UPI0035BE2F68